MKNKVIKITRIANINDIYTISRLFATSWRYAYANIINSEYLSSLSDEHWIDFLKMGLSKHEIDCLIIEKDSKIIGASVTRKSLMKQFPDDGELVCLYLLPEYIGKGAGNILLMSVEDLLRKNGYTHYILDVLAENKHAKTFYNKHGFKQTEFIAKTTLGNQELECNIMRKPLLIRE